MVAGTGLVGRERELAGLDGLVARSMIRLWTDDVDGARQDLAAAVERATRGEILRIGQALGFLGEVEYRRGALREAVVHTQLRQVLAEPGIYPWAAMAEIPVDRLQALPLDYGQPRGSR